MSDLRDPPQLPDELIFDIVDIALDDRFETVVDKNSASAYCAYVVELVCLNSAILEMGFRAVRRHDAVAEKRYDLARDAAYEFYQGKTRSAASKWEQCRSASYIAAKLCALEHRLCNVYGYVRLGQSGNVPSVGIPRDFGECVNEYLAVTIGKLWASMRRFGIVSRRNRLSQQIFSLFSQVTHFCIPSTLRLLIDHLARLGDVPLVGQPRTFEESVMICLAAAPRPPWDCAETASTVRGSNCFAHYVSSLIERFLHAFFTSTVWRLMNYATH